MKDALGMVCSGLCICHCLLTPVVFLFGGAGLLGAFLASEWMHNALLTPVLLLALASLPLSLRRHWRWYPLVLGAAGAALMLAGVSVGGRLEMAFSVTGASLLLAAHLTNRRLLKRVREGYAVGGAAAKA